MTYYGYVGNGHSVFFTKHDDNEGKAVGGKVSFHLPSKGTFDTLDVGLSIYHGESLRRRRVFAWGFDAQVDKGPWEVLGEFAGKGAEEDRTGFYVQPSYRFNEKWATFLPVRSVAHRALWRDSRAYARRQLPPDSRYFVEARILPFASFGRRRLGRRSGISGLQVLGSRDDESGQEKNRV